MVQSAPALCSILLISISLSSVDFPLSSTGISNIGASGMAGRSFQIGSISEAFVFSLISFSASAFSSERASARLYVSPFSPTVCPSFSSCVRNAGIVGVSGNIILKSSIPVPSSWVEACRKYRESVQSPALSAVIITVPAEPVNPEIHSRYFQQSAGYSLM